MKFPKKHKFLELVKKERREKVLTVHKILQFCNNIQDFKKQLKNLSKRSIDYLTKNQSSCENWFYFRKNVITATLTKRVCTAVQKQKTCEKINSAITKLHKTQLFYPAVLYGQESEEKALADFWSVYRRNHKEAKIEKVGFTHHTNFINGGSPDFIYECSCCGRFVGEIKCPYSLAHESVLENYEKLIYMTKTGELRTTHSYYYQIMTYLGIFNLTRCSLVIWSQLDFKVVVVDFDKAVWEEIVQASETYYFENYLPEFFKGKQ